jgi:uroporphyrinogen decarboxylase
MPTANSKTVGERFSQIVAGINTDDVLVTIWNTAPFLNVLASVELREYYMDAAEKLRVQLSFQDQFPGFFCYPGVWADFGALCEPSAFGCEIAWPEDGMPMAQPVIKSMSDIRSLRPIDPNKDGMMPKALNDYRYFWEHLDQKYIDEYGYLDGIATSFGPVELAAVLLGHENFYLNLMQEPDLMHDFLNITTESVIKWLKAHEQVNGPLKRIAIADHIPGQINREHFEEFWLPYSNFVLAEFPDAIVLYHNEFPVPYLDALTAFKIHLFHFGGELAPAKASLGRDITLMGNLHPVNLLLNGTPEEIRKEALTCIEQGSPGGHFLLSSAGGMAPHTPLRNLQAMALAMTEFRRKGVA